MPSGVDWPFHLADHPLPSSSRGPPASIPQASTPNPRAPGYLDVGVLHPGWRVGCGRVCVALEVEDSEGLLAGAAGPRQGEALQHGEAQCGVHMDGPTAGDPAGAQPVGQAWGPLHVTHLVGPDAVLLLIQAAQLLPLWGEGGLLSRWVRVSCRVFAMKPGGRLGDPWGARVQKTPALAAEMWGMGVWHRKQQHSGPPTPIGFPPEPQLLPAPPPEGMSPTSDRQFPISCSVGSLRQTHIQSQLELGRDTGRPGS